MRPLVVIATVWVAMGSFKCGFLKACDMHGLMLIECFSDSRHSPAGHKYDYRVAQ
jgi:hypothetical protein